MRAFFKKYIGLIYVLLIAAVVMGILIGNNELGLICHALASLDVRWVWVAMSCIAAYLFLRMLQLKYYLSRHGYHVTWLQAAEVTGAGQFYAAITPASSGGQPMQVLHLHRMGVPVSIGTACISVKFLGFQTGYLVQGGIFAAVKWKMILQQLHGFRWLVVLGYAVNAALIVAVLLTIPKLRIVDRLIRLAIRLGERIHIIRDEDKAFERFQDSLKDYRDALVQLLKSPQDALVMCALSMLQVAVYMWVTVCIYRAFGLMAVSGATLFTLQLMLFIAAAFVPLPGAAGAQESGFCAFFAGIFPGDGLIAAMVCWRFFNYYLLLALGVVLMFLSRISERKSRKI